MQPSSGRSCNSSRGSCNNSWRRSHQSHQRPWIQRMRNPAPVGKLVPSGKRLQKAIEKPPSLSSVNQLSIAIFNSKLLNYQRVNFKKTRITRWLSSRRLRWREREREMGWLPFTNWCRISQPSTEMFIKKVVFLGKYWLGNRGIFPWTMVSSHDFLNIDEAMASQNAIIRSTLW